MMGQLLVLRTEELAIMDIIKSWKLVMMESLISEHDSSVILPALIEWMQDLINAPADLQDTTWK